MSGFEIWIPKEHLQYYHQRYTRMTAIDVLNMRQRIEHHLNLESESEDSKDAGVSHQQAEHTSHSTTEGNLINNQMSIPDDENDLDGAIMDRADVLFKYILRSFRKHYCKSF